MNFSVRFLPSGKVVTVSGGTILDAAILAGIAVDAPCGGKGTCGKCLVSVDGIPEKVRACATPVDRDMVVTTAEAEGHRILTGAAGRAFEVDSPLKRVNVRVAKSKPGDNRSEWRKLTDTVSEKTGITKFNPNPELAGTLYDKFAVLAGDGEAILLLDDIIDLRAPSERLCAAAFDIGTTTIVCYLLDVESGEELAVASILNPQSKYGADVIQRSNYVLEMQENGGDAYALRDAVRSALNTLVAEAARDAGITPDDIYAAAIVGNTCMHHLYLGLSPASLVHSPYNPAFSEPLVLKAEGVLDINPLGRILMLPNIAGFVGADTVGVMLAADFESLDKLTLAVDIGTNGEMVLADSTRAAACSTAAGPAFEGAKITCGMRGAVGAIDHITVSGGKVEYSVIGGGEAKGICGSGLLDAVSELLAAGVIMPSGAFDTDEFPDRFFTYENQPAFRISDEVFLTQRDVREVQLAKGALAAGIELLAKHLEVKISDIESVLIAGAFGNYMLPSSACGIGLIPAELSDRISHIGNAAGEGSKMAMLSKNEWVKAGRMAAATDFVELAADPDFQDCYVDNLIFPGDDD